MFQKLFEYWKHFKRIDIVDPVDGIGKIDDYIPHPQMVLRKEHNLN